MTAMRRRLAVGALGGALVLTVAGCGGGSGSTQAKGAGAPVPPKPSVSAAVVTIEPANGAADVKPSGALKVSAANGRLTAVKVTGPDGSEIPGTIAADGSSWSPAGGLSISTTYQVAALAADANGLTAKANSSFTTLTPAHQADPHDNIDADGTYGVGMIVSLTFDRSVKNIDAVDKAISFETSDGTKVKPHWFGNQRVDFRPEKFWNPNTKVTVHYRLKNVEIAPGVYGGVDEDEPFTIGRAQISTADLNTHQMTVQQNGQTVNTIPFTAGKSGFDTWNGTMVIEGKDETTRMTSQGVAGVTKGQEYDVPDVPHAMRLTDSGTYVHGNYWSAGAFGSYNASHGCIGIEDAKGGSGSSDAGKFYASSLLGDVVTVVNSKGGTVPPDNGLSGWNLDWSAW